MLIYKDGMVDEHKRFFPNVSFPTTGPSNEFLELNNAKKVYVFKEHDRETEKLVSCDPYEEDGVVYVVDIENKTEEELQADLNSLAAKVRAERNRLLKESDWTQGRDIPQSIYEPWAAYREELRQLPEQIGFPTNIVWPISPDQIEE